MGKKILSIVYDIREVEARGDRLIQAQKLRGANMALGGTARGTLRPPTGLALQQKQRWPRFLVWFPWDLELDLSKNKATAQLGSRMRKKTGTRRHRQASSASESEPPSTQNRRQISERAATRVHLFPPRPGSLGAEYRPRHWGMWPCFGLEFRCLGGN